MQRVVKYFVALFFCTGFFVHCARVASITGGPKDTLAPVVVRMDPEMNTRNFEGKSIYVEFDEYVELKNLQREFYTSPGMKMLPVATIRGRGFRIDIKDTLNPDQTYSLNFAGAVVDNHEGNPLNGFRYVFSTGDEIDSLVMSGYTADAQKGDSVSKTFAFFFDSAFDSIPEYDSVIFKNLPEVIGRAENNGIFIAQNLKPKAYKIYAVQDENSNRLYDAGVDKIGFLEGVYNPANMSGFDAWYDTTRHYVVADPQLYFRMFLDSRPARQNLITPTRPLQHKIMLQFTAPWPQVEELTLDGIDSARIITEYLKPTRDSIALWLDVEAPPDTVKGRIIYMRPDSLGVMGPYTQELKLAWRKSESREEQRERERRERDIAEGREVEPEVNPFQVTLANGDLNPGKGLVAEFEYPLSWVDQSMITLTRGEDSTNMRRVAMTMKRDSVEVRKWRIQSNWAPGERYRLVIPKGAMRNVAGQTNDSIVRAYEVPEAGRMSTITVSLQGKTPQSEYVIQLTDASGSRVIDEKLHARTGEYTFNYVMPGEVRLKIIEDDNGNGEWNTGNLVSRAQPERVEFYADAPGELSFTVRAGWQERKTLDMNQIFAPITIESIRAKLAEEEEVRLDKLREDLARARQERARQEREGQGGSSAMDMMQGATGLNLPGF